MTIQYPAQPRIQYLYIPNTLGYILFDNGSIDLLARGWRILGPCFLVNLDFREGVSVEAEEIEEERTLAEVLRQK